MRKKRYRRMGVVLLCTFLFARIMILCAAEEAEYASAAEQAELEGQAETPAPETEDEPVPGGAAAGEEPPAKAEEIQAEPEQEKEAETEEEDLLMQMMPREGEETTEAPEPVEAAELLLQILSPSEAVVSDFSELKTALSQDNGITTVYLAANIEVAVGGISIHSNKTGVIIDGTFPLDETGKRHTLSDYSSATYTDCIRLDGLGATKDVTLRNLIIVGRNYYGTVSVPDILRNVTLTYENVDYTGPQITHNVNGTTRYIDTSIVIDNGNGGAARQEVAEAMHVEFGGRVRIKHTSTANWVFWFRTGEGSITVHDGADVQVTVSSGAVSFLLGYTASFVVGGDASFSYTAPGVFNDIAFTELGIGEQSSFFLKSTGSVVLPVLSLNGGITVSEGAALEIAANSSATRSVVRLDGNLLVEKDATLHILATGNFSAAINVIGSRSLRFEDPASVILYNSGGTISFGSSGNTLSINAQQINYWNTFAALPGAGGLDNPPRYGWYKADGSNFTISGVVSLAGSFTSISSNYTLGDAPGTAPSAATFNIGQSKMLSFGRFGIGADPFYETSAQITGATAPGAAVRASYHQGPGEVILNGQADLGGGFAIATTSPIAADTLIVIRGNKNFLTAVTTVTVEKNPHPGALEFLSVPLELPFETHYLSSQTQMVARLYPQWSIVISDTRGTGGGWRLYARALRELTPVDSVQPFVLQNSLLFVDSAGVRKVLRPGEDTLIMETAGGAGAGVTTVMWAQDRGVLAEIRPGEAYAGPYRAEILWTLADVP